MNMKYSVFSLKAVVLAAAVGLLSACAGSASTGPVPEGHYRVQPGDNLYRIGLRFGQSVNTLEQSARCLANRSGAGIARAQRQQ